MSEQTLWWEGALHLVWRNGGNPGWRSGGEGPFCLKASPWVGTLSWETGGLVATKVAGGSRPVDGALVWPFGMSTTFDLFCPWAGGHHRGPWWRCLSRGNLGLREIIGQLNVPPLDHCFDGLDFLGPVHKNMLGFCLENQVPRTVVEWL